MARSPTQVLRSWYVAFFQAPRLPEAVIAAADYLALRRVFRTEPNSRDAFDEEDIEAYVEAARRSRSLRGPINYYRAAARRNPLDLLNDRREIPHDTLVLWGEQDAALKADFAEPDRALVPNRRVVRWPDAGHWVHVEKPAEVNQELIAFLAG